MPSAEVLLWSKLKGKQLLGYKFRRQYSIDRFIVDFYCPALKLAIEIDGDTHTREVYDRKRQEFIESFGIQFLRFTNTQVYENLEGVVELIARAAHELSERKISACE